MSESIQIASDSEGWEPDGYVQPDEDNVVVDHEHPHPLETDQAPDTEGN